MGLMLKEYGDKAPLGLKEKIESWKTVAIRRSDNMWDFRKLSETQWCPTGPKRTMWNEPGNLLGFPACALAAISAIPDSGQNERLLQLSKAQMDNAFGRNPTGRHFSYDAPREIEGCELGWFTFLPGGIGQLAETGFVFDGAPKNEHYPYKPGVGGVGWNEGWVQFNVAFNISLAYMAYQDTDIQLIPVGDKLKVRLKAPLNFNYLEQEAAEVQLLRNGEITTCVLLEEGENAAWFSTMIDHPKGLKEVSYGYGYFRKVGTLTSN